jgi:hypothetical protein
MDFRLIREFVREWKRLMAKTFFKVLLGWMILISLVLGSGGLVVSAQTGSAGWKAPVNLSHSGWTMDPIVTADLDGGIHVLWQDVTQGNFQYTQTTDKGWSQPVKVAVPFPPQPVTGAPLRGPITLMALSHNRLAALWLINGELRYSVAFFDKTKLFDNWAAPIVVSTNASAFAVTLDAKNTLHMVYIQSAEVPNFEPGIYYTKLTENVSSWLTPKLLYASPYYRNGPTKTNDSVDVSTSELNGATQVYAAFDNQNRKRVFFARSIDGGLNWGDAQEIDGPSIEGGQPSPYNVRIQANQQGVMLVWQVSQSTNVCFQNYRYSTDGGGTWSASQRMRMSSLSCAEQIRFMKGLSGDPVLMTVVQDAVFLTAWDGQQWSDPQAQTILSEFPDPETLVNVSYGSRQVIGAGGNQIISVGCDKGTSGDTWLTTMTLTDLSSWFSGKATWRIPTSVHTVKGMASGVQLAADTTGQLHAIWSQVEEVQFANGETTNQLTDHVLYYSKWSEDRWSSPTVALRSPKVTTSSISVAEDPSLAIDASDHLLAVWRDPSANELLFSWASVAKATSTMEWSKPAAVGNINSITGSPDLWVDSAGVITLAYSIPINEQRGIYLMQSKDLGKTWSNPVRVFDGAAAGWEVVGSPKFVQSSENVMHLFWSQDTMTDGTGTGGVYYAQSSDAGQTWSKPETVSGNEVQWAQILSTGNATLLRAWQEMNNGQPVLLYQVSKDEGKTWQQVDRISNATDILKSLSMTQDRVGNVHLLDLVRDEQSRLLLRDLYWDGSSWSTEKTQDIGAYSPNFDLGINSAITSTDQLAVIGLRPVIDNASNQVFTDIFFTDRQVNIAGGQTPEVSTTKIPPTPVGTITPQIKIALPTATIDLASLTKGGPTDNGGTMSGLLIAGAVALIVVIGGVVLKYFVGRFANRG